jgi:hypothetical protein
LRSDGHGRAKRSMRGIGEQWRRGFRRKL